MVVSRITPSKLAKMKKKRRSSKDAIVRLARKRVGLRMALESSEERRQTGRTCRSLAGKLCYTSIVNYPVGKKETPSMVNVAVIGTGYIGPVHIEALRRISGIAVKGVADANLDLARKTAARYNIEKVYRDYEEVLADPSIHVIHTCAPNSLHYPMNKRAIEKGKHILSEKPLAMTLEQARELTELAEKSRIVTGINFCYRYYPVVLEMAWRVRRGDAGQVRMATGTWFQDWLSRDTDYTWRLSRQESGDSNISADLGSHWFDLVQFATGLHVAEVMADFATLIPVRKKPTRQVVAFEKVTEAPFEEVRIELEDYSAILFRLDNGAPGSFTTSQAAIGRKSDTEFQIYGSKLSYAWNHKKSNELWIGHRDEPNETLIESPVLQSPETSAYASLPTGHPLGYHDAMLNLMQDFYDVVKAGGKEPARPLPRPTFRTGYEEMRILKAVVESSRKRAWSAVA
jgi:predicted dehydrogenase